MIYNFKRMVAKLKIFIRTLSCFVIVTSHYLF